MKIEYSPGIMPGARIDLDKYKDKPKLPRLETYQPVLKEKMAVLSCLINEEYKQDFLSLDGRIVMTGEEAVSDSEKTLEYEKDWAQELGLSLEAYRDDKEKGSGTIAEMITMVLLNKAIGKEFIIARASDHDDFHHGVDSVIINKKTGMVICGFDEVVEDSESHISENKKKEKMRKIAAKGGAEIKYGATIKDGELVRASFKNIPAFYLSLSTPELKSLAEDIKNSVSGVTDNEEKIFNKLIASLKDQSLKLADNHELVAEAEIAISSLSNAFSSR